jgi:hypothetical protein
MIKLQIQPANHLISAYNQMMESMRYAFDNSEIGDMTLQQALDAARHQAVHAGSVTAEEAYELGEHIKRDINDAAEHMMEASAEFYDWLMLDIDVIERKVMDLFLSVAEHTRVELEQFINTSNKLDDNNPEQSAPGLSCDPVRSIRQQQGGS